MGTPPCMLARAGEGRAVDARADLFSLGALSTNSPRASVRSPSRWIGRRHRSTTCLARSARISRSCCGGPRGTIPNGSRVRPEIFQRLEAERVGAGSKRVKWLLGAAAVLVAMAGWTLLRRATISTGPVTSSSDYTQITDLAESAVLAQPVAGRTHGDLQGRRGAPSWATAKSMSRSCQTASPCCSLAGGGGKYGPVFTPEGSRVVYTELENTQAGLSWDTFSVPVLGGEPSRLLPNASGLAHLANGRVLFAEIRDGLHMGIVSATERRSESRNVYLPPHQLRWPTLSCTLPGRPNGFSSWKWIKRTPSACRAGWFPPTGARPGAKSALAAHARPRPGPRTVSGCPF